MMRVLGVDVGQRRIGLAISDPSRTLARPLATIETNNAAEGVERVAAEIARLAAEEDGLDQIVVGLPIGLDGAATEQTQYVAGFIASLRGRVAVPIVTADERLSSREAESRLAIRERDWRVRKSRLDAAAAAIILQDFLDLQVGETDSSGRADKTDKG
jgi:putative Holliday junction resolvase